MRAGDKNIAFNGVIGREGDCPWTAMQIERPEMLRHHCIEEWPGTSHREHRQSRGGKKSACRRRERARGVRDEKSGKSKAG